jgi:hypothetical protein
MDLSFRSRKRSRDEDDDDFGVRIEGVPADKVSAWMAKTSDGNLHVMYTDG